MTNNQPLSQEEKRKAATLGAFVEIVDVLSGDMSAIRNEIDKDFSQRKRREFVRNVFSFMEGTAFGLKQACLYREKEFLPEEIEHLRETSYEIDSKGDLRSCKTRIRTLTNVLFAFKMYAKVNKISTTIETSEASWGFVKEAEKIRNRITHPKKATEMDISDDELEVVIKAVDYYSGCFNQIMIDAILVMELEKRDIEIQLGTRREEDRYARE